MREFKQLTRAEFQIMSILWNLPKQSGFTSDILLKFEEPKPAYTTLATFLKILADKGYVRFKKKESKLFYTAAVSQEKYADIYFEPVKDTFFHGSFVEMMEYLLGRETLSHEETQQPIDLIHEKQNM